MGLSAFIFLVGHKNIYIKQKGSRLFEGPVCAETGCELVIGLQSPGDGG